MNGHVEECKQWIIKGDHDLGTAKIIIFVKQNEQTSANII